MTVMDRTYYVYILASGRNGTLYIGVTNNLLRRVYEHKQGVYEGFTKKYDVKDLVYFEHCGGIEGAIAREKTMKHWPRRKKLRTIEIDNPLWRDLTDDLV
jgi:putative endonuclease